MKIGIIGAGKMGSAILKSVLRANLISSTEMMAADKNDEALARMENELGVRTTKNNREAARFADVLLLAVKPQDIAEVIKEIAADIANKLLISIAAGVRIERLQAGAPKAHIVRVMPNISCVVGEAAGAFARGRIATEQDAKTVATIFGCGGRFVEVREELLDAVTGLSGSGPAYFFRIIEALAKAGERQGLRGDVARLLAAQTALGSAKLFLESGKSAKDLISMVATPGGTTAKGLEVMDAHEIEKLFDEVVEAATKRSKELSKA